MKGTYWKPATFNREPPSDYHLFLLINCKNTIIVCTYHRGPTKPCTLHAIITNLSPKFSRAVASSSKLLYQHSFRTRYNERKQTFGTLFVGHAVHHFVVGRSAAFVAVVLDRVLGRGVGVFVVALRSTGRRASVGLVGNATAVGR